MHNLNWDDIYYINSVDEQNEFPHYSYILNICIETGYFPSVWRTAIVCPT